MAPYTPALCTLLAVLALGGGCGKSNEYIPPPPPEVEVARPISRAIEDELEYTGTLRATESVDVQARVEGYLKEILFNDGQFVTKGDELFVIDPVPFEVAWAAADANLRKASATLAFSNAELERTRPLAARGAVSEQELNVKIADLEVAAAEVDAAEAACRQARVRLSYTRIKAPLSGRIGRHLVDVGNLVEAQGAVLTTIESYVPIHVYFNISESDMLLTRHLFGGNPAAGTQVADGAVDGAADGAVEAASGESVAEGAGGEPPLVLLGLPGETGYPFRGHLDFTQLGVDPGTGTQLYRALLPNEQALLEPGMFARVRVPIGGMKARVLVPERAVGVDQRGEYVLVVDGKDVVEYRPVTLGRSLAGLRVVESGLELDERIVVNGLQRARPGATVVPTETESPPGVSPDLLSVAVIAPDSGALDSPTSDSVAAGEAE